jgi:hypothetical protein
MKDVKYTEISKIKKKAISSTIIVRIFANTTTFRAEKKTK